MPQSLAQIYTHIVFSTKGRAGFLKDHALRERTHAYLASACANMDSPSLIVGGQENHVHILCSLSRKRAVADLIRDLKRESSKWIKGQEPDLNRFQWQAGYGAFSISPTHIDNLREYISRQETHHKKETFQDEFRRLLNKYGIQFDEDYVWD